MERHMGMVHVMQQNYGARKDRTMGGERVWIRYGAYGEYEPFNDIYDAAEDLKEYCHSEGERPRWRSRGFEISGFEGDNYISIYWGDEDGYFLYELSLSDRAFVNEAISGKE